MSAQLLVQARGRLGAQPVAAAGSARRSGGRRRGERSVGLGVLGARVAVAEVLR